MFSALPQFLFRFLRCNGNENKTMIEIRIIVTSNIFLPFISFYFFLLTGPSTLTIAILRPVYCNTIFNEQR